MKRFRFLAVGLFAVASPLAAASGSMNDFPLKSLPVLVSVDAAGKVTSASPAMELPPAIQRLLMTNLDEMVSGPAQWKGKPVSSQCIINVALQAYPRPDGNFDAGFAYLSSRPVPIGRWHWVNLDGRRLMLASDDFPRRMYPGRFAGDRPANFPRTMQAPPMPSVVTRPAAQSVAPAKGH
jgi:hypothetical protein